MKTILNILLGCMAQLCIAQNVQITTGKYTDCLRSGGICSFLSTGDHTKHSQNTNATFIQTENGQTVLRIYRSKITTEEELRLLTTQITEQNKNHIQFKMEDPLPLTIKIKAMTSRTASKQLDIIKKGTYNTVITEQYIDITLIE